MEKRQKGTIYESGISIIDSLRIACINKILLFDDTIDYTKFDFLFGTKQNRPKRLIKLLITLDSIPYLDRISKIIFNK